MNKSTIALIAALGLLGASSAALAETRSAQAMPAASAKKLAAKPAPGKAGARQGTASRSDQDDDDDKGNGWLIGGVIGAIALVGALAVGNSDSPG